MEGSVQDFAKYLSECARQYDKELEIRSKRLCDAAEGRPPYGETTDGLITWFIWRRRHKETQHEIEQSDDAHLVSTLEILIRNIREQEERKHYLSIAKMLKNAFGEDEAFGLISALANVMEKDG